MFHVHKNTKLVFTETPSLTFTLYMLQTSWLQIILKQHGMNGYFICVLDPFFFLDPFYLFISSVPAYSSVTAQSYGVYEIQVSTSCDPRDWLIRF